MYTHKKRKKQKLIIANSNGVTAVHINMAMLYCNKKQFE
jgi:hypothetical protein